MHFSLPKEYREAETVDLQQRITAARKKLGSKLCILAHHYQRMEVVSLSDHVGDSYGLSKIASEQKDVEIIVFCGVHFMVEAADILTDEKKMVFLPNPLAGCPMADMAEMADVMEAWKLLEQFGGDKTFMPISYMNTTAGLKAFTGRHGGLIERREKLFFFPDEHLGRNTAHRFGIKPEEMVIWDFSHESGGVVPEEIERAKIILWKGHCHVHTTFKPEHVEQVRTEYPDVQVVVHPECTREVVELADANGSTRFIVEYCEKQPAGSTIAIGTEINLINRVAHQFPDKNIFELSGLTCPVCANMYRTTLNDLAYTLENYADLRPISIPEPDRGEALLALQKMLEIC